MNEKHFWSPFGIYSIDQQDSHYHNDGKGMWTVGKDLGCNWNGPVWMPGNYMVMEGLINYGYYKQAKELAIKSANLVKKCIQDTGTLYEYFDG